MQVVDKKELGKRFICQTCFKLQKMKACIKCVLHKHTEEATQSQLKDSTDPVCHPVTVSLRSTVRI